MRVTVIPIVVGVLETVPKRFENRLEELKIRERINIIQTTAFFLDRLEYWYKSWRPEETYCHRESIKKLPVNAGV